MFNDINVVRQDAGGETISQLKVPLSYAPKRDFLSRIEQSLNGDDDERSIAIKLPRMSFEIVSMNYDNSRQLAKMNSCIKGSSTDLTTGRRVYSPVPYNIQFQLNIYAKAQDDALQIVEQILPQFQPMYTVTVKAIPNTIANLLEDTPLVLNGISFSDDYEAALDARRTIIYTLDFEMKTNLYRNVNASEPLITQYDVQQLDLDGNELFTMSDSAPISSPLSGIIAENGGTLTNTYTVRNAPKTTYNMILGTAPVNGTATVDWTELLTTVTDTIGVGSWSYTPDSDFFGVDSFTIHTLWGDSAVLENTVNMTITQV